MTDREIISLPIRLKEENRSEDRRHYYEIVRKIKELETDCENMALCLRILIDCYELVDEELYDCKRDVGEKYTKTVRPLLVCSRRLPEALMLPAAYSVIKACRLELLLADKYLETGMEWLRIALRGSREKKEAPDEKEQELLKLAYEEYLLFDECNDLRWSIEE